jgi:hypothetical protein
VIIYANLDQEARWARVPLPHAVVRRISAASLLLASFAPEGELAVIHVPASVDPRRLQLPASPVQIEVGVPPRWDVAWADPRAEAANDRRFALRLSQELGIGLAGARVITSLGELDEHLAAGGAEAGFEQRWVCKAPWTAAGRDRAHGRGDSIAGEVRVHVGRMLERFGALTFEPWMDRQLDLGVCVQLYEDGRIHVDRPHTLLSDGRGSFLGIDLVEPALTEDEHRQLADTVAAAGRMLHGLGYVGAFTVDGFVYRDHGTRKLHSLCELNARHTFGHVARAVAGKLGGIRMLGFGPAPAHVDNPRTLVAAAADDPFTAWTV